MMNLAATGHRGKLNWSVPIGGRLVKWPNLLRGCDCIENQREKAVDYFYQAAVLPKLWL